jgi:hypothetical protein
VLAIGVYRQAIEGTSGGALAQALEAPSVEGGRDRRHRRRHAEVGEVDGGQVCLQ